MERAKTKRKILFKHLDGQALSTGLLRLYALIYTDVRKILQSKSKGAR
jgi:hypothetical protein